MDFALTMQMGAGRQQAPAAEEFDPNELADTLLVHNHVAADQVTLSGSDVSLWANRGTLDMQWKFSTLRPAYVADADSTGFPGIDFQGGETLIARNEADSANKALSDFMTNSTFFMAFVAVVDAPAAVSYLLYDNATYFWVRNTNATSNIDCQAWDTGYRTSTLTRQAGALAIYAFKHEGGKLYKSLNGGAWDAGTALGNIPVLTGLPHMGASNSDHRILRFVCHNAIPAGMDDWLADLATFYGVS